MKQPLNFDYHLRGPNHNISQSLNHFGIVSQCVFVPLKELIHMGFNGIQTPKKKQIFQSLKPEGLNLIK